MTSCTWIKHEPSFNRERKAYDITCTDGNRYAMRFDAKELQWKLLE